MKKIAKILVAISFVFVITGCEESKKEEVINCTLTSNDVAQGYSLTSNYNIYSKGGEVTKVVTEEIVTSENEQIINYFEEYLKKTYNAQNDTYGGTTNEIKKETGKIVSKTTIDYDKMDMKKYVDDNSAMKNYVNSNNKLTKEGAQQIYEAYGATCK